MDNNELLNLAKGVGEDSLLLHKSQWKEMPNGHRNVFLKRREVRKTIYKIRKHVRREIEITDKKMLALKEIFDEQLDPNFGISYETFTFRWDVHPAIPTQIVSKEHWGVEGGGYDELGGHSPTAFTKQG